MTLNSYAGVCIRVFADGCKQKYKCVLQSQARKHNNTRGVASHYYTEHKMIMNPEFHVLKQSEDNTLPGGDDFLRPSNCLSKHLKSDNGKLG